MKPFKFLRNPILKTYHGENIFAGEEFYSMNMKSIIKNRNGKQRITPKYSIVKRIVPKQIETLFRPDYEELLYFKTYEQAIEVQERLVMNSGANLIITL